MDESYRKPDRSVGEGLERGLPWLVTARERGGPAGVVVLKVGGVGWGPQVGHSIVFQAPTSIQSAWTIRRPRHTGNMGVGVELRHAQKWVHDDDEAAVPDMRSS